MTRRRTILLLLVVALTGIIAIVPFLLWRHASRVAAARMAWTPPLVGLGFTDGIPASELDRRPPFQVVFEAFAEPRADSITKIAALQFVTTNGHRFVVYAEGSTSDLASFAKSLHKGQRYTLPDAYRAWQRAQEPGPESSRPKR